MPYQILYGLLFMVIFLLSSLSIYVFMYRLLFPILPRRLKDLLNSNRVRKMALIGSISLVGSVFGLLGVLIYNHLEFRLFNSISQKNYVYEKTGLAVQKNIDMLFVKEETGEEEEQKIIEYLQNMHIITNSAEKCISLEKIEYYCMIIEEIYVEGGQEDETGECANENVGDLRNRLEKLSAHTKEEYLAEAELWGELFDSTHRPSDLYQYSRALKDAVDKGYDMEIEELLFVASEAISKGEEFLAYKNRNINNVNCDEIIINAEDMGFTNGKIYYQLAERFANGTMEEKEWVDSFWMLSYACMSRAADLVGEKNKKYAKVHYYMGNIIEHMLRIVPTKSVFYLKMGDEALWHYGLAQDALAEKGEFYECEQKMEDNITNGIKTIEGLLTQE